MEAFENLSLANIVTLRPAASSLFEKHNLDYCCRGKQNLAHALKNDPEKLKEVRTELEKIFKNNAPVKESVNDLSLSGIVEYIIKNHHHYVKINLPIIQQHLEKVAQKHGAIHPYMKRVKTLFDEIAEDFEAHLMKEENILFPQILQLDRYAMEKNMLHSRISLVAPIQLMEYEHEKAGASMEEIKNLSSNYQAPEQACTTFKLCLNELNSFEIDLHQHVHLENNILFPKVLEMQQKLNYAPLY